MNEIICPADGGELKFDIEETRKLGVLNVYTCQQCGFMYSLTQVGIKPTGWKTKAKLERKELIDNIPF